MAPDIPPLHEDSESADKPVVLVCLQNDADLRQLASQLSGSYMLVRSKSDLDDIHFDICLADRPSLRNMADRIRRYQESRAPAFVPFLLLERNTHWQEKRDPVMSLVADVVPMPVSPQMLRSRINTLLRTRAYSLQLLRQNETLREERAFIDSAIQSLPGLFYVLNSDMEFIKWNENLQQELGYNSQELRSMHPAEFFRPQDQDQVYRALKDAFEQGYAELEMDIRTKGGEYVPYYITGKSFTREGSQFLVGTCTNLSDLREAQSDRDRQTRLLQNLFDHSPTAIALVDEHEQVQTVNQSFQDIFQYSEEEARGRNINKLITPGDQTIGQDDLLRHYRRTGQKMQFESVRHAKDGTPVPVLVGAVPVPTETGLIGSYVLYTDLRKQKQTEKKLSESRKRWEDLVQNDPDLIQITKVDGTILYVNPSGAELYGASGPEELIGRNYFDLLEIDDPEIARERIRRVMKGESVPPRDYHLTNKDGVDRYVQVQSVPITLESGETALQQVGQDLTERVRYERELEKTLKEREVLLQEIHHRVKNNLAVVSGLLQMQRFESDDERLNSLLLGSEMRIKSMALIHEKLYQSSSLSNLAFDDYIRGLVETTRKTVEEVKDLTIEVEADAINLNVNQAVPCALIINELLSNATEHAFGDRNKGTVWIDIHEEDGRVSVSVRDDGCGIPECVIDGTCHSMGYTIVNTLIAQLESEMNIRNVGGAEISFSFDKQDSRGAGSNIVS